MFLTTLLSALPLLNPSLPVQEPVTKTGQKFTCSTQEPVAKSNTTRTKTGKTARKNASKTNRISGKTTVNRSIVNERISGTTHQEPVNNTKKRSQNTLRRVTRAATATNPNANSEFDVSGLSAVKTKGSTAQIGTGKVHVGIEKARKHVNALSFIGPNIPQDNSPMWNVDTTGSNQIVWGENPPSPVDGLANVGNTTTTKTSKPAKKQNANKQVRKNRKR
jgi:hypothetical protein